MTMRLVLCVLGALVAGLPATPQPPSPPVVQAPAAKAPDALVGASQPDAGQMYVLARTVAFEARSRVAMGIELLPFGAGPAPAAVSGPRVLGLPLTPPVLAGDPRIAISPPVIRQALEEFVGANPGYQWAVAGPIVSVAPAGASADASNWLNATVPSFDVRGATVRDALLALRRQFDPQYDGARLVMGRTGAVVQPAPLTLQERIEQAQGRRFDLRLERARVRDILDAIVLAHGEAGWLVSFDGSAATAERARVEVVFWQGSSVIAYATVPSARPPAVPSPTASPRMATLPLTRESLQAALTGIARGAGRAIGIRFGPDCRGDLGASRGALLDLEGLGFEEAVDLVLSHCAGYERRTVDGVSNVGPAGTFGQDGVLDSRQSRFKVTAMPFSDTLFEVGRLLGWRVQQPRRSNPSGPPSFSGRAQAIAADQATPITVELKKATVRTALNAVVAAHGAAWWTIDGPGFSPQGLVRLSMGGAGWGQSIGMTR